ncbi:hypothetical protein HK104_009030 [Borealophlyctis nickersoniae]|nr:hypothetical protein HK104_009030 [Borealophlyctis nickersoniae]
MGGQSSKQAVRKFPTRPPPVHSAPTATPVPPPITPRQAASTNEGGMGVLLPGDEKATREEEPAVAKPLRELLDPREEDKNVVANFNRLGLDIQDKTARYRKDNPMLSILAHRKANEPADEVNPFPTKSTTTDLTPAEPHHSKLPAQTLEQLFNLRRTAGPSNWPPEKLAERFKLDVATVEMLIRYVNTPERIVNVGHQGEVTKGIWVDDLLEYRRQEAAEATKLIAEMKPTSPIDK